MRRIFIPFVLLLAALFVFASCLNSDDNDVVYYDDTAITSFSLGTMNRYVHTKSSTGADSVYKTTYSGSNYAFYIDQLTCEIYNVDSLPKGTDAAHVITTISTKNGGTAVWKSAISDTLVTYSSSDSVNLSVQRELRVYANDGSGFRTYKVRVNVHQEEADVFNWSSLPANAQLAAMSNMRATCQNGKVYVYGNNGEESVCYSTSVGDGKNWSSNDMPVVETIQTSAMTLSDDKYAPYLPAQDMSMVRLPKPTNPDVNQLVLVGNRSVEQYPDDKYAVVWGCVEETAAGAQSQPWIYYTWATDNPYLLPRLQNLQVVKYGDQMLALGGKGIGACTVTAFKQLYASRDGGITWKTDARFQIPDGFSATNSTFAMTVDENQYLWIICGGSGQVWRGRLSQLGWQTQQKVF